MQLCMKKNLYFLTVSQGDNWTFFSHYTFHIDLVSITPPKLPYEFPRNFTWLKCTICRCREEKNIYILIPYNGDNLTFFLISYSIFYTLHIDLVSTRKCWQKNIWCFVFWGGEGRCSKLCDFYKDWHFKIIPILLCKLHFDWLLQKVSTLINPTWG